MLRRKSRFAYAGWLNLVYIKFWGDSVRPVADERQYRPSALAM
ncbi:hypothetical protein [Parachitinimonas caeni]|uniref:Uncharacterized protein n=1 Tax=Parachitinimonas caeni TaxID=3031301 RepID=A0ABT7DTX1_9NEIS|nr:hypothetical protein [Parachitinimonas caeni]MDK2123419.1 hypothetical protein [Parachitinimonas caeni]